MLFFSHFYFTKFGKNCLRSRPALAKERKNAVTDQELRKLGRRDLLELLIAQGRERDALQAELEEAKTALRERELRLAKAGSIAEAALQLNGVFEAAQNAAEQYLDSVRAQTGRVDELCSAREAECEARVREMEQKAAALKQQAEEQAKTVLQQAEEQAASLLRQAEEQAAAREKEAEQRAQDYWQQVEARLDAFYKEHEELRALLKGGRA